MQWFAQAPANIALIKYMGKKDDKTNTPINPSLSYTLNNLQSSVELATHSGKKDFWEPLEIPGAKPFTLTEAAQTRFLLHLARIKETFEYSGAFVVRSSNHFPTGSGLASSASSFAALTKCAFLALCELTNTPLPSVEIQARMSQQGSGSSCRSFFSPWALWRDDTVGAIDLPYNQLLHQVILISKEEKKVLSSQAHQLIRSSKFYETRSQRAEHNLKLLLLAFQAQDWENAYHICFREFQDIHQLFATCATPFTYINEQSKAALKTLQEFWEREGDGPLVTMDAGPNIHILYRPDQTDLERKFRQEYLVNNYDVL